jgi:hypothetical protein
LRGGFLSHGRTRVLVLRDVAGPRTIEPFRPTVVLSEGESATILFGMNAKPAVMQFDTLDYARKLETAGVPGAQAEAQARALGEVLGRAVAFPGDLVTLENNLTAKLAMVESRLDSKIDELGTRIETVKNELRLELGGKIETLKWMFGVLVALNVGILIRLLAIH